MLTYDTPEALVNAFVILRLDYSNGLYANIPQGQSDSLQFVFNGADRSTSAASHFSPLWRHSFGIAFTGCSLQCPEMIRYQLWVTVFKALNNVSQRTTSLSYLIEVVVNERRTTLRSTPTRWLVQQRRSPSTEFGDHTFSAAAPAAWNSLPDDIREIGTIYSFKLELKSHLFLFQFP